MNKTNEYSCGHEGFILIPRRLLKNVIAQHTLPVLENEAFLIMLYTCNYSDIGNIQRGEANLTISQWSKLFCWKEWQTRAYFDKLTKEKQISQRKEGRNKVIGIINYEELCGKYAGHPSKKQRDTNEKKISKTDLDFERFWAYYHEVNKEIIPSDKELARKEWGKLSAQERIMAHASVYDYYMSLSDIKHERKACNYLKYKSFII